MVNDYRTFTAWALGVIAALLASTLIDAGWHGGWILCLVLFALVLLASFWRIGGAICTDAYEFIEGAMDARRVRRQIDDATIGAPEQTVERLARIAGRK